MPDLPRDVTTNNGLYGYTASTMEVKMQSGETKEEPTLPYLLRHLPKYKALGCLGIGTSTTRSCPLLLLRSLSMTL